jgi:hypothetical protein
MSIYPSSFFIIRPFHARRVVCALAIVLVASLAGAKPDNPGKGKGKGQSPDFVPPGLVGKDVPPGHRRAPVEFIVRQAPPAIRVEAIVARPSPRHVWVQGYWVWSADTYVWTPGVWMLPPEPAAVWVTPRFETRSGVNIFISGYWKL